MDSHPHTSRMASPARKTIALLRELAKGTTYSVDMYIVEAEKVEEQHPQNIVKQKMLCDYILNDFTSSLYDTFAKRRALDQARFESAEKNFGDKTVRKNILALPNCIAK